MNRRKFLAILAVIMPSTAIAHSPWGQFQVYRQKHLLILTSREDEESYPYSKLLAVALNREQPNASARPARAINLKRVYNLLRTKQFTFTLLPTNHLELLEAMDLDNTKSQYRLDLSPIYTFGDLVFLVQNDFDTNLVRIVTHALAESAIWLPDADSPLDVLANKKLHPGAYEALEKFN